MTSRQAKIKSLDVVQTWVLGKVVDWVSYHVTQRTQEMCNEFGFGRSIAYYGHSLRGRGYIRKPLSRGDRVRCDGKTFVVTDRRVVMANWDMDSVTADITGQSI